MDGLFLLYSLRNILNEYASSSFLDTRTSYEYLWKAAKTFASRSGVLRSTQSITTVADQSGYTLNADFDKLYLQDTDSNYVVKYNDGSINTFPMWKPYEEVIYEDNTTSLSTPTYFTLIDDPTLDSKITGTATSAGALSGGLATLTDTAGNFSDVSVGDAIHNTTDGSSGYVVSKTSSTVLSIALFGGSNNDWSSSDAYVIQPQGRIQLILNPPPSTASHTVTVFYQQIPSPVFSDYGVYRFQQKYMDSIIFYAAWLYKYRDREPDFGDRFFAQFDSAVREANSSLNRSIARDNFKISFRKR